MSLSGEAVRHTFLGSMKWIVRSPCGLGAGRCSVGELKVHRDSGRSVRHLPAPLLDVEHDEGKRRVRVTCAGVLPIHSPPPRVVGHGCCRAEIMAVIEATFCFLSRVS
jgi:hypothetical protein